MESFLCEELSSSVFVFPRVLWEDGSTVPSKAQWTNILRLLMTYGSFYNIIKKQAKSHSNL